MTISGNVGDGDWSVVATTHRAAGGFDCLVKLSHHTPQGVFKHEFMHSGTFPTEHQAILAGLGEGMDWVRLKMSNTLSIQPCALSAEPAPPGQPAQPD